MIVRLLLAVLTVAGPMPVGVCTCAAARGPALPPVRVVLAEAAAPAKSCGCQRHAVEAASAAVGGVVRGHADWCAEQPARHDHHDRDCPAANPTTPAPTATPTPAADLPADPCLAPAAPLDAPVCGRTAPRPDPAPQPLPLYLSHCSIRV